MEEAPIFVINSGSSSLKFGLCAQRDGDEQPVLEGEAEGIGHSIGRIELRDVSGRLRRSEESRFASQAEALECAAEWLAACQTQYSLGEPSAIGIVSSTAGHGSSCIRR